MIFPFPLQPVLLPPVPNAWSDGVALIRQEPSRNLTTQRNGVHRRVIRIAAHGCKVLAQDVAFGTVAQHRAREPLNPSCSIAQVYSANVENAAFARGSQFLAA